MTAALAWQEEWGPFLDTLLRRAAKGHRVEALEKRPVPDETLAFFHEGWHVLQDRRPIGMNGAGPLPLTEVVAYLDILGVTDTDLRIEFLDVILRMDRAWLARRYAAQSAEVGSGGERTGPGVGRESGSSPQDRGRDR